MAELRSRSAYPDQARPLGRGQRAGREAGHGRRRQIRAVGDRGEQHSGLRGPGEISELGSHDGCKPVGQRELLGGGRVSDQAWQNSFHTAIRVSAAAALGCAVAWREDFRADISRVTVPVLIVQGAQDRVMPPGATGNRLAVLLADARLAVVPEGPHAIIWTHAAEVNRALVGFLRALLRAPRQGCPLPWSS